MPPASPDVPALLVLVGPTASGKTALSLRLADRLGGEVVSADSVQVYRGFDIGSGKPTPEERARVPHHLVDVRDATEPLDAAAWAALADTAIADIRARGRVPIVCGGTFLWVRALLHGLSPVPPADPGVRARHSRLVEAQGRAALHAELARVDPEAAARLAPNDTVRVSRALETFELTGVPQTKWHAEHAFKDVRHPARLVGIRHSSDELTERIRARVNGMLDAGFVEEVRALAAAGYRDTRPMQSVGYREVLAALDAGALDRALLAESIVRATRIFARRQRTWLREQPVLWLTEDEADRFSG
ncbi:MAG TPA: tRNA (adenosine(37)-N6)-dimethylallyltransferase MiaA [Polyangiaceae bacterium]|nr:tRNA (adenosine(37)-N6)-dimethylallyltransferase MiaA [Polyangiaceae bacterium]